MVSSQRSQLWRRRWKRERSAREPFAALLRLATHRNTKVIAAAVSKSAVDETHIVSQVVRVLTLIAAIFSGGLLLADSPEKNSTPAESAVVVYGGTSGGVIAAVQSARLGKT